MDPAFRTRMKHKYHHDHVTDEIINLEAFMLLPWVLTAASIKMGRPHIARREIECAELRLGKDGWPEYYDGKSDWYIGKQA
ncbi:probable alkaline/neutral invertase B [Tanacetum coccineum]